MLAIIPWIPVFPLLGFIALVFLPLITGNKLPHKWQTGIGVGSVGISALLTGVVAREFWANDSTPFSANYAEWISTGGLEISYGVYWDKLTTVMACVVTWVGFLIHVFSASYMATDKSYARYFAYLNLFIASMLVLILADNLLLLYMGWEGVGVCSFLLIGFWYENPENGVAATKAFVMTRVGDVAMALALFIIYYYFNTLNINELLNLVTSGSDLEAIPITLICLLLLGGAVGKSAQIPLQNWLPDAMAGPTPVSALIHAATMVTAGVYLIARMQGFYEQSLVASQVVATIGLLTLLLAAFSACVQTDIKRVLAYSTISQIGYMFLALGIGAYSSAVFHLMTHAVFKALLFLGAGYLILCLHEEQNMFKMGALVKKLPLAFWSLLIGSASLAALPGTPGYLSKHQIVDYAWAMTGSANIFWLGAVIGSVLTGFYAFRMLYVSFMGDNNHDKCDRLSSMGFFVPLILLSAVTLLAGLFISNTPPLYPIGEHQSILWNTPSLITVCAPFVGILFVYIGYRLKPQWVIQVRHYSLTKNMIRFLFKGWGFDFVYRRCIVVPYKTLARLNSKDAIDRFYDFLVSMFNYLHRLVSIAQNGQLSWYTTGMVAGSIIMVGWVIL